ncbi:MAG: 4Fe-4S binding protein, partial [Bacteroidota bacterium]
PRIAIEAVANGKKAAQSIHSYLSEGEEPASVRVEVSKIPKSEYTMLPGYETMMRAGPATLDTGRRTGIAEVEKVYEENDAVEQAARCLICHIDTIYDPELCVLCGRCSDVCPENCLMFVPFEEVDLPEEQKTAAFLNYGYRESGETLTVLLKDDTACIRCGLCAIRCPTEAMTMERFNFIEKADT